MAVSGEKVSEPCCIVSIAFLRNVLTTLQQNAHNLLQLLNTRQAVVLLLSSKELGNPDPSLTHFFA